MTLLSTTCTEEANKIPYETLWIPAFRDHGKSHFYDFLQKMLRIPCKTKGFHGFCAKMSTKSTSKHYKPNGKQRNPMGIKEMQWGSKKSNRNQRNPMETKGIHWKSKESNENQRIPNGTQPETKVF